MAQSNTTGSIFPGGLSDFVGEIFGHPTATASTPGGTMSADAKETNNSTAAQFPPNGSQILAPATGAEAALSRTVADSNPITFQNRPAGLKWILMVASALAVVYLLKKG